jgi:hypothetical protein
VTTPSIDPVDCPATATVVAIINSQIVAMRFAYSFICRTYDQTSALEREREGSLREPRDVVVSRSARLWKLDVASGSRKCDEEISSDTPVVNHR